MLSVHISCQEDMAFLFEVSTVERMDTGSNI